MSVQIGWGAPEKYEVIGNTCYLKSSTTGEVLEKYQFQTVDIALLCAKIFNHDLYKNNQSWILTVNNAGVMTGANLTSCSRYYISEGCKYLSISQDGTIEKLDVPYLLSRWLRASAMGRFINLIWHGKRGQK